MFKSQPAANKLKLVALPNQVQNLILKQVLLAGHGNAFPYSESERQLLSTLLDHRIRDAITRGRPPQMREVEGPVVGMANSRMAPPIQIPPGVFVKHHHGAPEPQRRPPWAKRAAAWACATCGFHGTRI